MMVAFTWSPGPARGSLQRLPRRCPMTLARPRWTQLASLLVVCTTTLAAMCLSAAAVLAADQIQIQRTGQPQTGMMGISRTTADIMRDEAMHPQLPGQPTARPE